MTERPLTPWIPEEMIGDRLRRLRRAVGLSQIDFATILEVTPQALATYETGRSQPRSLVALAKRTEMAFNVPATWVLGLDSGPTSPQPPSGEPANASNGSIVLKHVALVAA